MCSVVRFSGPKGYEEYSNLAEMETAGFTILPKNYRGFKKSDCFCANDPGPVLDRAGLQWDKDQIWGDWVVEERREPSIRKFIVERTNDVGGVSGTGYVCEGVIFTSGKTVVSWLTDTACISIWESFEDFKSIHINSHPENETKIHWFKQEREEEKVEEA